MFGAPCINYPQPREPREPRSAVWEFDLLFPKPPPWRSPVQPGKDQCSVILWPGLLGRERPHCRAQALQASLPPTMVPPPALPPPPGAVLPLPWCPVALAQDPTVSSAAPRETPVQALQARVGWAQWDPQSPLLRPQWTAGLSLLPTISYLPALTAAPCPAPALWAGPSLARVPHNSMDWGPVAPACRPLPLTVVLLVTTAASLLQAARAPRGLPSPSGPAAPTAPAVLAGLTVALRDLTDPTSSWAPDTRDLTTSARQARALVLHHTDRWDLTDPCMVPPLTSWTGKARGLAILFTPVLSLQTSHADVTTGLQDIWDEQEVTAEDGGQW